MRKESVGTFGCVAVLLAVLFALAGMAAMGVFGDLLHQSVAAERYALPCLLLGLGLFVLGSACGIASWATRSGKVAAIVGLALGIPFAGLVYWLAFIFTLKGPWG